VTEVAGREGALGLAPDFEVVARLRGHRHKPGARVALARG
jgi:hypothetical protein